MEKTNRKLGVVLTIAGLLCTLTWYFDVLAIPALVVNLAVALFVGFVAMMQTYNDQGCDDINPGFWWTGFSLIFIVIIVIAICLTITKKIEEDLSIAIAYGLCPLIIPLLGVFLGFTTKALK